MTDHTIFVFPQNGALTVFPTVLPVKGRGADHITLQNSSGFTIRWSVPKGVFDDVNDHSEDVLDGRPSGRQKVKARNANVVAYKVTILRRAAGAKKIRRVRRIKSDPIIIIDIDRRKKRRRR